MLHYDHLEGLDFRCYKKGGGTTTDYLQSPEAQQALQLFMPSIARMGTAAQYGGVIPEGATYEVSPAVEPEWVQAEGQWGPRTSQFQPPAPHDEHLTWTESTPGYWTEGKPAVTAPMAPGTLWDVPDTTSMMPTTATMEAISPDVKQGVMSPYVETSKQLAEQLYGGGGASARGGISGQAAAGLGRYWGDVAPEYTKSLWGMTAPAQMAGWQAETQARQYPYTAIPSMYGASMPTPMVQQGGGKK